MKKKDFLEKWIECLPLNSKDQDRKEMSYDLDLLMAKGQSEQLRAFKHFLQSEYHLPVSNRMVDEFEQKQSS
jgi:hypothetical protein